MCTKEFFPKISDKDTHFLMKLTIFVDNFIDTTCSLQLR